MHHGATPWSADCSSILIWLCAIINGEMGKFQNTVRLKITSFSNPSAHLYLSYRKQLSVSYLKAWHSLGLGFKAGIPTLWCLLPDDLRWKRYNNNQKKVCNKSNSLESSPNQLPTPGHGKKCLPWNSSMVPKVGDQSFKGHVCAWVIIQSPREVPPLLTLSLSEGFPRHVTW